MSGTTATESAVRDLIQRYKICWEVWPECIPNKGRLEKTGFELDLLGTHAEGTDHVSPGCDACIEVYYALWRVADLILPQNEGLPTRYEIEPFETALHYAALRKNRADVVLEVKIMHRNGLGPIDACEERCLQLMQNKLHALGAYRGCWAPDPNYPSSKYKAGVHGKRH